MENEPAIQWVADLDQLIFRGSRLMDEVVFFGVAESGDDFTKFSTISQWFQMLIHPPLMQRLFFLFCSQRMIGVGSFMNVTEEL